MIKENLNKIFEYLQATNPFGEKVILVGATKTQTPETILQAVKYGLKDIGENKPQEFRDKFPLIPDVNYHFFGRLQKNKVKYLIGKAYLIQSVDSLELAEEINNQSSEKSIKSNILLEVNLGEEQKGGFPLNQLDNFYQQIKNMSSICIKGLMTVLPKNINETEIRKLCLLMRKKYDIMRQTDDNINILSMGMSVDYKIAIDCGSNMIRIGTGIFGERNTTVKENI